MVVVKNELPKLKPTLSFQRGVYILWIYWVLIISLYLTVDLFLDLYTTNDFAVVAWWTAAVSLPLAAFTLYYMRKDVFGKWYTYIFSPLIAFGLYFFCTYFNALNLDLLLSAAFKPTTEQVLPVENVERVFSRKAGFMYTDVSLIYHGKKVVFQGTRTSYFLLKNKKALDVTIGRSYFGNYFATGGHLPAQQRWAARYEYLKDWFHRYLWLIVAFPLLLLLSYLKDKLFPSPVRTSKPVTHPYRKFFDLLLIIVLSVFGLFILILLLAGAFL